MKQFLTLIIFLLLGWLLACVFGVACTKEYIQDPTCFKYIELHKRFSSELIYTQTDTVYPSGSLEYVCDGDVLRLENFKDSTHGCIGGGYDSVYYKILKP